MTMNLLFIFKQIYSVPYDISFRQINYACQLLKFKTMIVLGKRKEHI